MNKIEPPTPKVFVKTFGCQMNEYDSYRMIKLLESSGYEAAASYADASVILLNTCSVRQKAEDKIYSELGRFKKIKRSRPDLTIGVGGCLAQQEGNNLLKRFPYLNLVFGTKALSRLPHLLKRTRQGERIVDTDMNSQSDIYPVDTYTAGNSHITTFVTVTHGCNNYCSYCIVPYVRGPEISRKPDEILNEVKNLVRKSFKEVTLLGQNVNSYGKTLSQKVTFSDLLYSLNEINGLERIRFITSHPKDLSKDLIASFTNLEKLCEHIHLPLQSGSNKILKTMNRNYSRNEYIDKVALLRGSVPGISITSDIIVGFPDETEADFKETLSLIKEIRFDDLFIFHYTDRPSTRASKLSGKVPYKVKIERLMKLNKLQREISIDNNRKMVGKTCALLFENASQRGLGYIAGRTRTNKVVNCRGSSKLIGKTALVNIEKANIHSLTGKIIEEL